MKIRAFWDVAPCSLVVVNRRFRVRTAFIALMMETVRTSATSIYSNETTGRYIPEGSNLCERLYFICGTDENLKYYLDELRLHWYYGSCMSPLVR
jgi:hypothetical protein